MKTEEKLLKLVQRLLDKTKAGETKWEETVWPDSFQTSFPNNVVRISKNENGAVTDYVISVLNEVGTAIESADDAELSKAFPRAEVYRIMSELYGIARRRALGVDAALDSLLSELG
jgi:hypothetical protein